MLPEPLLSPAMVKVDKVLIVATSREVLGDTSIKTGVWCAVLEARDSARCGLLWSPLHSKPNRIVDWQGGGAGSAVLRLQAAWVRAGCPFHLQAWAITNIANLRLALLAGTLWT